MMQLDNTDSGNDKKPLENEASVATVEQTPPSAAAPVIEEPNKSFNPNNLQNEDLDSYKQEIRDTLKQEFTEKMSQELMKEGQKHPAIFLGNTVVEMSQDVANAAIDTVNYIDRKFGDGEELLENLNYSDRYLPQDNFSKTTRSLAKFVIGSNAIYKGSKAVIQGGKWTNRAIKTADPFVTEFFFETTEPQREQIVELGKDLPILHDLMEYIDPYTEDTEKNFERRLHNSMFGLAEAGILTGAYKVLQLVRKNRKLIYKYLQDESGQIGKGKGKGKGGGTIKPDAEGVSPKIQESPDEILPPIPKPRTDLPPLPKDLSGKDVPAFSPNDEISQEGLEALKGKRSAVVDEVRDIEVLDELGREEFARLKKQGKIKYDLTPEEVDKIIKDHDMGYGSRNTNAAKDVDGDDILNLTFMNTEEDLRKLVKRIVEVHPEKYNKKKYTEADLLKLARARETTPKKLLRWTEANGLRIGDIIASELLLERAAGQIQTSMKRYANGELSKEFTVQQFQVFRSMAYKVRDQRSMAGLLLRETGVQVKSAPSAKKLLDMYDVFAGDLDSIAKEVNKADVTPNMITKAMNWARGVPLGQAMMQIRFGRYLSGPITHIKNFSTTVSTTAMRPVNTGGAATLNTAYSLYRKTLNKLNISNKTYDHLNGATYDDMMSEIYGGFHGIGDAFKITASKIRGKDVEFEGVRDGFSKIPMFLKKDVPKTSQEQFAKALVTVFGNPALAGAPLEFSDQFMKHINANMTKRRMVQKELRRAKRNGASDDVVEQMYKDMSENPPENIKTAMYDEAEIATFTERNKGKPDGLFDFKGHLRQFANVPMVRFLAPFGNVNINMINYGMQQTVLSPITRDFRQAVFKGTPEQAQQALAKATVTTTALSASVYYMYETGAIVGSGSRDYNKKRLDLMTGKGQNYITVGGRDFPIDRDNPYFNIMFTMVDLLEVRDKVGEDEWKYHYGELVMAVASLFKPGFIVDSTSGLIDALESEDPAKMEKFLAGFAKDFVTPYGGLADFINKDMGLATRPETTSKGDVLKTFRDQIVATYAPQLSAKARNILGQEMEYPTGFLGQITDGLGISTKSNAGPVMEELRRLSNTTTIADSVKGVEILESTGEKMITDSILADAFTMPPRVVDVTAVVGKRRVIQLKAEQYEKLMLSIAGYDYTSDKAGVAVVGKKRSINLEDTIAKLMSGSWYKNPQTSDRMRFNQIKSYVSTFKQMGEVNFALREYGKELLTKAEMKKRVDLAKIDLGVK